METLTMMAQKEAIAMRIITVVTLLYLPATFVSVSQSSRTCGDLANQIQTFFSTDIVKYQNQGQGQGLSNDDGTSFSSIAMYRWLQVTLPLTALTLFAAWMAYERAKGRTTLVHIMDKMRKQISNQHLPGP
jgi:hypothetical protein